MLIQNFYEIEYTRNVVLLLVMKKGTCQFWRKSLVVKSLFGILKVEIYKSNISKVQMYKHYLG